MIKSNLFRIILMIIIFFGFWCLIKQLYIIENLNSKYEIFNNLEGIEGVVDGNDEKYKKLNTIYLKRIKRYKDLNANKWETRFPSLVKYRYNYNDYKKK